MAAVSYMLLTKICHGSSPSNTVLGLEISVQYHDRFLSVCAHWPCILAGDGGIAPDLWRVGTVVTAVQRRNQLRKHTPHELLFRKLIVRLQLPYHPAQVTVAAVLHVQEEILGSFQMLSMVVGHDVWMP